MTLEKQKVLEDLCELATDVGAEVFGHMEAHDCVCGKNQFGAGGSFQFSPRVLDFIREAVREKMAREEKPSDLSHFVKR